MFPTSVVIGPVHINFKLKVLFLVSCYYGNEAGLQTDQSSLQTWRNILKKDYFFPIFNKQDKLLIHSAETETFVFRFFHLVNKFLR